LESALAQPRQSAFQTDIYATLPEKGAALAFFISENRPFLDGNKRVATVAMISLLRLNAFELQASEDEVYEAIMSLASKTWDRQRFFQWVCERASPV
jgi:death on curing protein